MTDHHDIHAEFHGILRSYFSYSYIKLSVNFIYQSAVIWEGYAGLHVR